MFYAVLGLIVLISLAFGLYYALKRSELEALITALRKQIEDQEHEHDAEVKVLNARLARLNHYAHIPDVVDRAEQTKKQANAILRDAQKKAEQIEGEIAVRMDQAQQQAFELLNGAFQEANHIKATILGEIEADAEKAKEARQLAERQANNTLEEARKQAKQITAQARKEAKEKARHADEILGMASAYAQDIRSKAELRAEEIAGHAYEARQKLEHYEAAARAMQNVMSGYKDVHVGPAIDFLDELADEYSFHETGERLKLARQRTRLMQERGLAATCNYPEGWKRDYAIDFVLSAFNGRVDSILARVKPAQQKKMAQAIRDAYALVNHNGEVFRNARIQEEYLNARLEELRWAVAVQRLKVRQREEQRAIREQMREEEKARRDYERAIKQAEKEEALINQALERARKEFESASEQEKVAYESKLRELNEKLRDVEERNQKAISMAQQTKCGHVYIISNIGSFGENVYKIGLTRRLEPTDRVRELGDASVPFPFDIHAMIYSENAPNLESMLHKRFVAMQVNKMNKRKEFFRANLHDIRRAVEELGLNAHWTIEAEATEYRETVSLEQAMRENADLERHWIEDQTADVPDANPFADDEAMEEIEAR